MRPVILLTLLLVASCGGEDRTAPPPPAPPPANRAPVITSPNRAEAKEGTLDIFYTLTATDADGNPVTFSIAGGADGARFKVDAGGRLSFQSAASFDTPADADLDNIYQVTVSASDGTLSTNFNLEVTVAPVVANTPLWQIQSGYGPLACSTAYETDYRGGYLLVAQKDGKLFSFGNIGSQARELRLDISDRIAPDGVLGCAVGIRILGPTYYRYLYVSYLNKQGRLEVSEYASGSQFGSAGDPATARASERVLVQVPQQANANFGGGLWFSNGALYIGVGDLGTPQNAADEGSFAGKLLRVPTSPIPAPVPQIIARGLRDPATLMSATINGQASLLIGDRGVEREEINLLPLAGAPAHFGWPIMDGTRVAATGLTTGLTPPVAEYMHGTGIREGSAIVLGLIGEVRGDDRLLFGDRNSGNFWTVPVNQLVIGRTLPSSRFVPHRDAFKPDKGVVGRPVSITDKAVLVIADEDGEIYVGP